MKNVCVHFAVAFVCYVSLLNLGVKAQPGPAQPPARPVASPSVPPVATDKLTNQLTSINDHTARLTNNTDPIHRPEPTNASLPAAPKISPLHPQTKLAAGLSGAKLNAIAFEEPDAESESAPRSFVATAYNIHGRTASGVYVRRGVIAADPRVLPIGSVVQVKAGNYSGIYTVHDTGRRVKGRSVDIWMPTSHEARSFGRRRIKLQVLRYSTRRAKK